MKSLQVKNACFSINLGNVVNSRKLQEKERETKLHWESLKNMSKDGRDKSHVSD